MKCPRCLIFGFLLSSITHSVILLPFFLKKTKQSASQYEVKKIALNLSIFQEEKQVKPKSKPEPESKPELPKPTLDPKSELQSKTKLKLEKPKKIFLKKENTKLYIAKKKKIKRKRINKLNKRKEPKKNVKITPNSRRKIKKFSTINQRAYKSGQIQQKELAYINEVRNAIERRKFYPVRARRDSLAGMVVVSFDLKKNGQLHNLRISKSSGFSVFDQAALKAVENVGKFPEFPKGSKRQIRNFSVPLQYRLSK